MELARKNIKIVLVEPLGERNLGSVARLCKNFGIDELRLVSPRCDPLNIETRKMALKGIDLLKRAHVYSSLQEAVNDCVRVIATSGRTDHGKIPLHNLDESLNWLLKDICLNPVAIVFGREDCGLTNSELKLAHRIISIDSLPIYRSLNLSHAVGIVLHDLIRYIKKSNKPLKINSNNLSTTKEINDCLQETQSLLLETGFLYEHTKNSRMSKLRAMLQRAEITSEEVSFIRGILRQTKWFIDNKSN